MNKFTLLLSFLLFCFCSIHGQGLQWAKRIGGTGYPETCNAFAVDAAGYMYLVGSFSTTVDFDPGPGASNLTAAAGNDYYLLKLAPNGDFVWVKRVGGTSWETGQDIAIDAEGNLIILGVFAGIADFDPGPGVSNLQCVASSSIFIQKLDADGNFIWAKNINGGGSFFASEIVVDSVGFIYSVGRFSNNADFDPGLGVFTLNAGNTSDAFVQKLDPDGNFVWAKQIEGTSAIAEVNGDAIAMAPDGNLCFAGSFRERTDFDPGPGVLEIQATGFSQEDIFIEKIDPDGKLIWVRTFGSNERDLYPAMTIDADGNILTTGRFALPTDFDPGPGVLTLNQQGSSDMYVQKLDSGGNFKWARSFGGASGAVGNGIAADASGNVFITGGFSGAVDFDQDPEYAPLIAQGNWSDIVLLKLDANGNYVWADGMGSNESEGGLEIGVDPAGNIYAIGTFQLTVDFDAGPSVNKMTSAGSNDIFILKLGQNWNFHGKVFNDLNGNLVQDTLELGFPGFLLRVEGQERLVSTDSKGHYRIYHNISGYTIKPALPFNYLSAEPPFAIADSTQSAMDFALHYLPGVRDVGVTLVNLNPLRAGFHAEFRVFLKNHSPNPLDSIALRLELSTHPLTLRSADPMPDLVTPDSLIWHIDSLGPFETKTIDVSFNIPVGLPLNDLVSFVAIGIMPNDAYIFNNTDALRLRVVGSFDPNDKQVYPEAIKPEAVDSSVLTYVVRFQNTGNFPADFVVIRDTLPKGLDASSLEMLGASHPFRWHLYGQGILEVHFDPIFLPDSNSNEPASHGFVAFNIRPEKHLVLGDSVLNRAGIYFDYNPPIITNDAVLRVSNVSSAVKDTYVKPGLDFKLLPNPAASGAVLQVELPEPYHLKPCTLRLLDAVGRRLQYLEIPEGKLPRLVLGNLPAGSYYVQVQTADGICMKVLVVR